jgi:hypothetical protein
VITFDNGGAITMTMTSPNKRPKMEKVRRVKVGDHDIVSWASYRARVPLCGKGYPGTEHACTRAAGHNEGTHRTSGSDHVATGTGYIAVAVWS